MAYNEEELRKIITVAKIMDEKLRPSEMRKLMSLIEDFVDKRRISHTEFSKSFHLLLAGKVQKDEDRKPQQDVHDTQLKEGEIRQNCRLGDPKIHQAESNHLSISAEVDGNNVLNLEGKKRRILLQSDPSHERPVKRTRTSKRLGRVTPSYKLIPEEEQEQSPAKDTVLNNKCCLMRLDGPSGNSTEVKDYEEAMARCEDEMFETDMLMEAL
uniref:Histone deacetylase interacting domain-containing protein n=1 Tax=Noccaea caerulescens TaxID=107243 RepID=A0A1J3GH96_NOCCA